MANLALVQLCYSFDFIFTPNANDVLLHFFSLAASISVIMMLLSCLGHKVSIGPLQICPYDCMFLSITSQLFISLSILLLFCILASITFYLLLICIINFVLFVQLQVLNCTFPLSFGYILMICLLLFPPQFR